LAGQASEHVDLLRQIHSLFEAGAMGNLTDGDLLEQFRTRRREIADHAFAALVQRHGPMVWRVCRRVLIDPHEAEDAFQATFMVLVQHAATVRSKDSVSSWLYGVACRIAQNARSANARRQKHERRQVREIGQRSESDLVERAEVATLLAEELGRLPERYRAPLLLCDLEDETYEKAANQLGWPVGTVKSRLARGREKLRCRLARRGLAPAMAGTGAILVSEQAEGGVPSALIDSTVRLGLGLATGGSMAGSLPGASAVWAREVSKAMWMSNLRWSALAAVTAVAAGIGGMFFWQRTEARPQPSAATGAAVVPGSTRRDDDAIWARHVGNLKRIGLALHNYLSAEGHFPPAAITDKDGKPLLSWRVAILPYLEDYDGRSCSELFKEFHLNEPWDSPQNQTLLAKMPAVFASPAGRDARGSSTAYRGFVSQDEQVASGAGMAMMSGMMGGGARGMMGGMMRGGNPGGMVGGMGSKHMMGSTVPNGVMRGMMGSTVPGGMMSGRDGADARSKRIRKRSESVPDTGKEQGKKGDSDALEAVVIDGRALGAGGYGAMMGGGPPRGRAGGMMAGRGSPGSAPAAMMGGGAPGGEPSAMMGGYAGMMRQMMTGPGMTAGSAGSVPLTMFCQNRGVEISEVTDGTSNTLMVVEAADAVPWTKPDDLPFSANAPLPRLGGSMRGGFAALFADGRVRFLDQPVEEWVIRCLITPWGGEILSSDQYPGIDDRPPGGVTVSANLQAKGGEGQAADSRQYAGARTLLNAVGILRDKLNREGKSELAEWLGEAKARRAIRAGLQTYETYLRRSGEPQQERSRFEILRPVFEQIADKGTWPAECWFTSSSSVETRDRIVYDHSQVLLNLEGLDRDSPFQLSILILDLFSGPVDAQPPATTR
jgi:RNA polymerase sigma factor (sigma-70 family)